MNWIILVLAGLFEIGWAIGLKYTEGWTRLWPSVLCAVGYALAFYLLSLVMRTLPTGVVYAGWSGLGIVLIAAVGWVMFGQKLDAPALIGMGLIVAGVAVIQLFSKTAAH